PMPDLFTTTLIVLWRLGGGTRRVPGPLRASPGGGAGAGLVPTPRGGTASPPKPPPSTNTVASHSAFPSKPFGPRGSADGFSMRYQQSATRNLQLYRLEEPYDSADDHSCLVRRDARYSTARALWDRRRLGGYRAQLAGHRRACGWHARLWRSRTVPSLQRRDAGPCARRD